MLKLEPIGIEQQYFNAAKLRAWGRNRLGTAYSKAALARLLGWSETSTRHILAGLGSPYLETYCRAIARVDEPFGTWLDHVSPNLAVDLDQHGAQSCATEPGGRASS